VTVRPTLFSGQFLDRRAELRDDPQWVIAARSDPATRYVLGAGAAQLVTGGGSLEIAFLSGADPLVAAARDDELTLLGWFRGARCVLVEWREPDRAPELPTGTELKELRPLAPLLPADSASLLAYARALGLWKSRHRFCGSCGAPNLPARAGHVMRCSRAGCGHETFPRLDPAIIVLVSRGDHALLGRKSEWPAGMYSTIAGFVEPGESLECAVEREVMEETGIKVADVRYHSSQPWPFPASLMLGYYARAVTDNINFNGDELEDARWFSREELAAGAAGRSARPRSDSIARRLIDEWLTRGD